MHKLILPSKGFFSTNFLVLGVRNLIAMELSRGTQHRRLERHVMSQTAAKIKPDVHRVHHSLRWEPDYHLNRNQKLENQGVDEGN